MDNLNYWPSTNIHELNLDWIIAKVKELDTRFTDDIEAFVREYIDEHFAEWTVNANYDPDDETIIYTNGTGATLTAGDVIRFAIDNAFVQIKDATARSLINTTNTRIDNIRTDIGSNTNLQTVDKTSIVNAINENVTNIATNKNNVGALSSLNTSIKTSIVDAINSTIAVESGSISNFYTWRKENNICNIDLRFVASSTSSSWADVTTVIDELKPSISIHGVVYDTTSWAYVPLELQTNGLIRLHGVTAGHTYYGNICYIK